VYGLNPLRRARQERGLTLQDVASVTKLSPRVLTRIELGNFDALPPGVMGRAHIRAYAVAVGLDPDEVLKGLADLLPAEIDPVQAMRARARQRFADDHPVAAALGANAVAWHRHVITLLRTRGRWRSAGPWRLLAAGAVDGMILGLSAGVSLVASAWITDTDVSSVWRAARWPFLVYSVLIGLLYGLLSQQLGRRTPGAAIAGRIRRAIERRRVGPRVGRWHVWG
jgi:transcriptional regulator with XRE-family HTH domain